ncbi:hypothetical protein BTS2_0510 [Bacillus sp. TS-2]|nr:hypothetical protein BTS2_0510 [Bacillus sp. TS-2]
MNEQLMKELSELDTLFLKLDVSRKRTEKTVNDLMNDLEKEVPNEKR